MPTYIIVQRMLKMLTCVVLAETCRLSVVVVIRRAASPGGNRRSTSPVTPVNVCARKVRRPTPRADNVSD